MYIAVIDYGSGNLKSAAKALEAAAKNINKNYKIEVTSDPKKINKADKIVLPGQGSFRDCYLGIKKISGLIETLNEKHLISLTNKQNKTNQSSQTNQSYETRQT